MSPRLAFIYRRIHKVFRKRRFAMFLQKLAPNRTDKLLDVGGTPDFWMSYPVVVKEIDTINLSNEPWDGSEAPEHHIRTIVGDGCQLPMESKSYDICFSNSVIEHVGSWENQKKFAEEVRRVGKSVWVQTPAYESILEPHYMTLFTHHFPNSMQKKMLRWTSLWGLLGKPSQEMIDLWVDTALPLRKQQMIELFPDCEILTERIGGILPKSYIAIRRDPSNAA